MIKLEHISKTFGGPDSGVHAVRDVSLEIEDGEIFGIIGFSGAGKSTLVRCINLLERPTSGTVTVDGQELTSLSERELRQARKKISMIFQSFNLLMQKNCLRNVCFPLELAGVKKAEATKKAQSLLELVGLPADFAGRFPHELSGGQLQRVCIARAVACSPEVILFDEAISSLDAHTQVQIMDLLRELKEKLGLTYVFITHDLTSIAYLCDDVLFLYQGHVTEYLPVSRISETKDEYARRLLESIVVFDTEERKDAV